MSDRPSRFPDGEPPFGSDGLIAARHLDGDEWLIITPLTLGRARVAVARWDNASLEHY